MENQFITITPENLGTEHLCCIIRTKVSHPGVEAKKQWLSARMAEGHTFRKLQGKACVFIEYAPLETAWVPILGDKFFYIYCLWNENLKGRGYGSALMNHCIEEAKAKGRSGLCMLGAQKQKHWLADQAFAKKFGFEVVDSTPSGYELLALSFDGTKPRFAPGAKEETITDPGLTIYYDHQCPYVFKSLELVKNHCEGIQVPVTLRRIDSLEEAKAMPCVFHNWAVFYGGKFVTVNLLTDVSKVLPR